MVSRMNAHIYLALSTNSASIRNHVLWPLCLSLGYNVGQASLILWQVLTATIISFWGATRNIPLLHTLWSTSFITSLICTLLVVDMAIFPQPPLLLVLRPTIDIMIATAFGGSIYMHFL